MISSSRITKTTFLFSCLFCSFFSQAETVATDDTTEKGPYYARSFSRSVGVAIQPSTPKAITSTTPLLVDRSTKESNELIITLNHTNRSRLATSLSNKNLITAPAGVVEDEIIRSIISRNRNSESLFGGAVFASRLVGEERMSDDDRARGEALKSPRAAVEKFLVLRYESVALARAALERLLKEPSIATAINNVATEISAIPSDPYFTSVGASTVAQYQWGMHSMNFPSAWDVVRGHSYIGILEPGYPGTVNGTTLTPHPDLASNYRSQFSPGAPLVSGSPYGQINDHAIHVSGIIAATHNSSGVAGGCKFCSIANFTYLNNTEIAAPVSSPDPILSQTVNAYLKAIETGMQVINWSGSTTTNFTCPSSSSPNPLCSVLYWAAERSVLAIESSGNSYSSALLSPLDLATQFMILPVGGTQIASAGASWQRWYYGFDGGDNHGSNYATTYGVVAPAKSIVSTITNNSTYNWLPYAMCGDAINYDESGTRFSGGYGDGVGTCTGTSMSAPHVSALAGLALSINPRITASQLRQLIWSSGDLKNSVTPELGHGLPNALTAVNLALESNPSKLTPLFSFYSATRRDSFYTTVPQMGNAALDGSLRPRQWLGASASSGSHGTYESFYGSAISGYSRFPRSPFAIGGSGNSDPLAEVWIFTTHVNPKSAIAELSPLYRLSWKCGDATPAPAAICQTAPSHIDVAYANASELAYFNYLGYRVDGIEGYIYPKDQAQPVGTVKLMRMYNSSRDDHAIFPATKSVAMSSQGYTDVTNGSDWLGYVYPNANGTVPVIQ